jgi:hypothetical protein
MSSFVEELGQLLPEGEAFNRAFGIASIITPEASTRVKEKVTAFRRRSSVTLAAPEDTFRRSSITDPEAPQSPRKRISDMTLSAKDFVKAVYISSETRKSSFNFLELEEPIPPCPEYSPPAISLEDSVALDKRVDEIFSKLEAIPESSITSIPTRDFALFKLVESVNRSTAMSESDLVATTTSSMAPSTREEKLDFKDEGKQSDDELNALDMTSNDSFSASATGDCASDASDVISFSRPRSIDYMTDGEHPMSPLARLGSSVNSSRSTPTQMKKHKGSKGISFDIIVLMTSASVDHCDSQSSTRSSGDFTLKELTKSLVTSFKRSISSESKLKKKKDTRPKLSLISRLSRSVDITIDALTWRELFVKAKDCRNVPLQTLLISSEILGDSIADDAQRISSAIKILSESPDVCNCNKMSKAVDHCTRYAMKRLRLFKVEDLLLACVINLDLQSSVLRLIDIFQNLSDKDCSGFSGSLPKCELHSRLLNLDLEATLASVDFTFGKLLEFEEMSLTGGDRGKALDRVLTQNMKEMSYFPLLLKLVASLRESNAFLQTIRCLATLIISNPENSGAVYRERRLVLMFVPVLLQTLDLQNSSNQKELFLLIMGSLTKILQTGVVQETVSRRVAKLLVRFRARVLEETDDSSFTDEVLRIYLYLVLLRRDSIKYHDYCSSPETFFKNEIVFLEYVKKFIFDIERYEPIYLSPDLKFPDQLLAKLAFANISNMLEKGLLDSFADALGANLPKLKSDFFELHRSFSDIDIYMDMILGEEEANDEALMIVVSRLVLGESGDSVFQAGLENPKLISPEKEKDFLRAMKTSGAIALKLLHFRDVVRPRLSSKASKLYPKKPAHAFLAGLMKEALDNFQ